MRKRKKGEKRNKSEKEEGKEEGRRKKRDRGRKEETHKDLLLLQLLPIQKPATLLFPFPFHAHSLSFHTLHLYPFTLSFLSPFLPIIHLRSETKWREEGFKSFPFLLTLFIRAQIKFTERNSSIKDLWFFLSGTDFIIIVVRWMNRTDRMWDGLLNQGTDEERERVCVCERERDRISERKRGKERTNKKK